MKTSLYLTLLLLLWSFSRAQAQDLAQARQLSQSGRYAEAESAFSQLLVQQPQHAETLLARGFNFSWWGRYAEALQAFSDALDAQPGNFEAQKGAAFTLLYQGKAKEAAQAFENLTAREPSAYDLFIGKGLAHQAAKDYRKAQMAFKRALELQPQSAEARQFLQAAALAPAFLETDIWLGFSRLDADVNQFNLRGAQLSVQAAKKWRALFKYDNSLALDILNLARRDRNAPLISAGLVREWNGKSLSEAEYGLRFLEEKQTQQLISAGQVFFLPNNSRLKAGGLLGFGQNLDTEWMAYASYNAPLGEKFRLEPTYYFIQPPNAPGPEHRLQLGLQYQSRMGYQLNLYGLYGNTLIQEGEGREPLFGWSLTALAPFSNIAWAQLTLRQEKGVFYNFTSAALGLKVRINK